MSDDFSPFDKRMRKPGAISLVVGVTLGFMAIQSQRIATGNETTWLLAIPYGLLAAGALYAVIYRNLERQLEQQS